MNYREEVLKNCPNFSVYTLNEKLSMGGLGCAGEAGEVADIIKKVLHHNCTLDKAKLIKEMGDVYWYLEYLCATLNVSTEEVLRANVEKLNKRHPDGWSYESQNEKRDE